MKIRRKEGYVLIYVLVVMVLIALIATGVLTISLNNLKGQQAAAEQMVERYRVQGQVEEVRERLQQMPARDEFLAAFLSSYGLEDEAESLTWREGVMTDNGWESFTASEDWESFCGAFESALQAAVPSDSDLEFSEITPVDGEEPKVTFTLKKGEPALFTTRMEAYLHLQLAALMEDVPEEPGSDPPGDPASDPAEPTAWYVVTGMVLNHLSLNFGEG